DHLADEQRFLTHGPCMLPAPPQERPLLVSLAQNGTVGHYLTFIQADWNAWDVYRTGQPTRTKLEASWKRICSFQDGPAKAMRHGHPGERVQACFQVLRLGTSRALTPYRSRPPRQRTSWDHSSRSRARACPAPRLHPPPSTLHTPRVAYGGANTPSSITQQDHIWTCDI